VPDQAADNWQPWLARHRGALFLMARQYLPTPEEAEDAVHDGVIKFWNSRQGNRDPAHAAAYLFTCVRSAAIDRRRSNLTRTRHENRRPASIPPLFQSPLEQSERRQQIEHALAQIPLEQREVLILKIWADGGGLTFAQIAETLGIPPNTAASRYRYALQSLESLLAKEFKNV
jgi:RNA polymerase sigma-70 factor, ECF subfamily